MPKFSAPKVFYTTQGEFYAERGGQFSGHPKGYGQYFDIANNIVSKKYYRGHKYSKGDKYIFDRSNLSPKLPAKGGAPGSWIKATLSAHITYVVKVR
ncbi:Beta protein [compost metagenome]